MDNKVKANNLLFRWPA